MTKDIKDLLESKYKQFANPSFIDLDPISIPKGYHSLQDIEITAFWTAIFSWGQRKTIINKARTLFELMDNVPYQFIVEHQSKDLVKLEKFVHRTFQATDTLYFISFLKHHYTNNHSLESAFLNGNTIKERLSNFHDYFFSLPDHPERTRKHIATPKRKSTCKRLNMFLRWMVRSDAEGIDFNLWNNLKTDSLMIPFDVHVERVARKLGLIKRKQRDWLAVEELTNNLKKFDPEDPIKYDFALFGMGVMEQE